MSEEQEDDMTGATETDEERALTQAELAKARAARDVLNGPTGDALRAALRSGALAENIDTLAVLPETNVARLVEGIMPSLSAAAMFPAFDTARLVEGIMPSLSAAAMFPAFDTARLVEGIMPSLSAAAMFAAFDTGALIRGALPVLTDEFFDRIRRGFKRLVPRNLRSLDDLRYEDMITVMREEGIPFVLIPDAVTAAVLLDADDAGARRLVLVDRAEAIFEACEGILALCVDPSIAFPGSQVRQAIGAYRSGFPGPAQAEIDGLPTWDADLAFPEHKDANGWIAWLEGHGVFFSHPLDLDLMMLEAYPDAYEIADTAPPGHSTKIAVLGKSHANTHHYSVEQLKLFREYQKQFKLGSKPASHLAAMATFDGKDELLVNALPGPLARLLDAVRKRLESKPE